MEDKPTKFADKYRISSSHKTNWDYSTPGLYFVTICTYRHNNFFGRIINHQMELSKMGLIINQCLIDIPKHFKNVLINESVIMPNHIHLLLELTKPNVNSVETRHGASLQITIPKIINQFKSAVTKQINPKTVFFAWQPRYHDIIIKDEKQYFTIKNYIKNNVINWEKDKYFEN